MTSGPVKKELIHMIFRQILPIWLISLSTSRIRQYKAGRRIVYVCHASEGWGTFNCVGIFFTHFLTLKQPGAHLLLGTHCISICPWGGGLGREGEWGFLWMVCGYFLLNVCQGNAIRETERVSGQTSLCLVIVTPQSWREKGTWKHLCVRAKTLRI